MFGDPFGSGGRGGEDDFFGRPLAPQRQQQQQQQQQHQRGNVRGGQRADDPFALMDSMMGGSIFGPGGFGGAMDRGGLESMMRAGGGGGGGVVYSSSTVMTSSGNGTYQHTVTHRAESDGRSPVVSERREQIRDSRAGTEKLSIGRRIGDRARTVTKERDRLGDERTLDTIENIGEDGLSRFDDDWDRHHRQRPQIGLGRDLYGGRDSNGRLQLQDDPPYSTSGRRSSSRRGY